MFVKAELNHLQNIIKIEQAVFKQPWSQVHFVKDLKHDAAYIILDTISLEQIDYLT